MKYTDLFILLLAAFCVNIVGYSQDTKKETIPVKSLVVGAGYSQFRLLDLQQSPLIYKSQLFKVSFGYTREKDHGLKH